VVHMIAVDIGVGLGECPASVSPARSHDEGILVKQRGQGTGLPSWVTTVTAGPSRYAQGSAAWDTT